MKHCSDSHCRDSNYHVPFRSLEERVCFFKETINIIGYFFPLSLGRLWQIFPPRKLKSCGRFDLEISLVFDISPVDVGGSNLSPYIMCTLKFNWSRLMYGHCESSQSGIPLSNLCLKAFWLHPVYCRVWIVLMRLFLNSVYIWSFKVVYASNIFFKTSLLFFFTTTNDFRSTPFPCNVSFYCLTTYESSL